MIIPGPSRLDHVQSTLPHLLPLIPDAGPIRGLSPALSIIRRHIAPAKASRANGKRTSARLVSVIVAAHMNIQRNVGRPSARHGIRHGLAVNRVVITIGPTKAKIGDHIGMRHTMPKQPEEKPNAENLDDAPPYFRKLAVIGNITHNLRRVSLSG